MIGAMCWCMDGGGGCEALSTMCGAQCCNVRCYDRGKVMVHCGAKHSQLCVVRNAAMCGVMIRGKVMVNCGAKHSQLCVVFNAAMCGVILRRVFNICEFRTVILRRAFNIFEFRSVSFA